MNLNFDKQPPSTISGYGMLPEALMGGGLFRRAIAFNADGGVDGGSPAIEPPTTTPEIPTSGEGEDVSALVDTMRKERIRANEEEKRRKELERQFKQLQESVKGIDPEKYKQFEALQAQAEEWNKKEVELRNNLESDFQARITAEQEKIKVWEAQYNDLLLRTETEKAYQLANGRSGGGDDGTTFFDLFYQSQSKRLQFNPQSKQLEVIDQNGVRLYSKKDSSKPMSAVEYFQSLITHPVFGYYFQPDPNKRGSGTQPGSTINASNYQGDLSKLPRAERLAMLRGL